jgi:hypothetical protein
MAEHNHTPVEIDPAAIQHAQNIWSNSVVMTKYTLFVLIAILALMFVFLL